MALAHRDLETARDIFDKNVDWCFNIAYNAMLQAARAVMFSNGYRTVGAHQHVTTIEFIRIALGEDFAEIVEYMDRMRKKRNQAVYDMTGLVSSREAAEAVATAEEFISALSRILETDA